MNTRCGRTDPYRPDALGLDSLSFGVPRDALRERGTDETEIERESELRVTDPNGIPVPVTPD